MRIDPLVRAGQIEELGSAIDAAACDDAKWVHFADAIRQIVPGTKILFQVLDGTRTIPPPISRGWGEATIERYAEHYWKVNPWHPEMAAMPMSSFRTADQLYPRHLLLRSEFYAELMRPEGEADGATALKFGAHRDREAILGVHYDARQAGAMDATLRSLLSPLLPRLKGALEVNRVVGSRSLHSVGAGILGQFIDAAMVLDADCQLLSANDGAAALLREAKLLDVGARDIVHFKDAAVSAAFARSVATACSRVQTGQISRDLRVHSDAVAYAVTCLPITMEASGVRSTSLAALYSPQRAVLVVIRQTNADDLALTMRHLQQKFGLTRSETKLLSEFNGGGTLRTIAERLGVSHSTVQTHLRSIFAKTGVSKQRDLMVLFNTEVRENTF